MCISKKVMQQQAIVFILFCDNRRLLIIKAFTILGVVFFFNAHALDNHTYSHAQVAQWWQQTTQKGKRLHVVATGKSMCHRSTPSRS